RRTGGRPSRLLRIKKERRVVPEALGPSDKFLDLLRCGRRFAGKDPQAAPGRLANNRPAIVVAAVKHPVIAVEWAKEADLELGAALLACDLCPTPRQAGRPVLPPASID